MTTKKTQPISHFLPGDMSEKRDQQAKEIRAYRNSKENEEIVNVLTNEKKYEVDGRKYTARKMKDGYEPKDLPSHRKYQFNKESGKWEVDNYNRNKDRPAGEIEEMVGIDEYNMGKARVEFQATRKELQEAKSIAVKANATIKELMAKLWLDSNEEEVSVDYDPDIWPIDLTTWRNGVETWHEREYPEEYTTYMNGLRDFMKDARKFEETGRDVTIKEAGLKVDKKPVWLDIVNHPKNTDGDVFIYEWEDYNGNKKNMVGIKQKVLNDPAHPMYEAVQDIIKQRKQEWYRPATKQDFKKIIGVLPTKKEEGLLWIEMLAWLFGWWVLEKTSDNARSFVELDNYGYFRNFDETNNEDDNGSLFFVQDC